MEKDEMGIISLTAKSDFRRGRQQLLNRLGQLCAAFSSHGSQQPGREGHSFPLSVILTAGLGGGIAEGAEEESGIL